MKIQIPSQYIRGGVDVKPGDIVQLLDEGEYRELPSQFQRGENRTILTFQIELPDKQIKSYTMNKSTQRNLIAVFGDDSKNWIKKDLKVHLVAQNVGGKMREVIYLTPPNWESPFESPSTKETQEEEGEEIEEEKL